MNTRRSLRSNTTTPAEQSPSNNSTNRKRPKSKTDSEDDGSSSDSSVGDYLKTAEEIDLNSSFFKFDSEKPHEDFDSIEKKIFRGIQRLSESENESEENDNQIDNSEFVSETHVENSQTTSKINFSQLHDYNKKIEEAKACVEKYKCKKTNVDNKQDIKQLLSLGETKIEFQDVQKDFGSDDEMDWEEIEEKTIKQEDKINIPKEGVQITVELPTTVRKKTKGVDFLAVIKRRMNRIKKENQVYVHKVHLLCWLAHGNYLNSVLNNENILGPALSLLPSDKCYPPKLADMKYLEQIVKWYGKMMKLQQDNKNIQELPLIDSLQNQISKKQALNLRDFILIFIIILRSLGLQCRLVLSFVVLPLRPPSSELCSLSTKEKKENEIKTEPIDDKKASTSSTKRDSKSNKLNSSKLNVSSSKISKEKNKNASSSKSKSKTATNSNSIKVKSNKSDSKSKSAQLKTKQDLSTSLNNSKAEKSNYFNNVDTSDNKKAITEIKVVEKVRKSSTRSQKSNIKTKLAENSKVSQVDGADDSDDKNEPSTSKSLRSKNVKTKPNIKIKLKKNLDESTSSDICISQKHPRASKSKTKSNIDSSLNIDADFKPKPNLRKLSQNKDINANKKVIKSKSVNTTISKNKSTKLDVRNDIINLIKDQMVQQKNIKKPLKKEQESSDYDSDYIEEPIVKKTKSNKKLSNSDEDFKFKVNTTVKRRNKKETSKIDTRVLSSDDEEASQDGINKKKKIGNDVWLEVFLEEEEKWISVDLTKGQIHCVSELHSRATQPVSYVVAWNNNLSLKDITARYSVNWNTVTRKLRADPIWWIETLRPYIGIKSARDKEEDEDLARQQLDKPLPKTINEYKNHPLYVLKRHLLKFEAIYPPDALTLGFVRNEAVYARECVHTLHSREIWVKHAKVVKPGQQPYKIVKARPKYDKLTGNTITDLPLEIFGIWQVGDYVPPTAENGIVPRNAFGNVELFKACMLPKKTVHLQLPGLNKVARKLQIDCAPAVVGFDFHCGGSHPTFDGYVVCEEFKDVLVAAWEEDQEEIARKELEKIDKRVYGNWRKLIKGLLIRERLKARYDFGGESSKKTKKGGNVVVKKRKICSDDEGK